ncbi:MAG: Uma2 family endonuclease [Gemmatimonadota bacterium]
MAIEVLSPSDRVSTMAEKIAQYFGAGTRLVWLIDPEDEVAVVYRSAGDARVVRAGEELDGEDLLPGFHCGVDRNLQLICSSGRRRFFSARLFTLKGLVLLLAETQITMALPPAMLQP